MAEVIHEQKPRERRFKVKNKIEPEVTIIKRSRRFQKEVKRSISGTNMSVKHFMAALFPEADFRPVSSSKTLDAMRKFDNFQYAIAIDRRVAKISLGSLFAQKQIGFGANVEKNSCSSEKTVVRHLFQWLPSFSDWSQLINTMLNQLDPNRILIRLKCVPLKKQTLDNLKKTVSVCDQFLASARSENATLKEQATIIKKQTISRIEKLMEDNFNVGVFLFTSNMANGFLGKILGNSITASKGNSDGSSFWEGGFRISKVSVNKAMDMNFYADNKEPFTAAEASCAFRLPSPPFEEVPPGFPVKRFRTALAITSSSKNDENSILLADNIHQGVEKPVMVDRENRLRHCTSAKLKDILDIFSTTKIRHIHFTGGEATFNLELPAMVQECVNRGIIPSLTTNGLADWHIYKNIVDKGLREIRISCDTFIEDSNNAKYSWKILYNKVVGTIQMLVNLRDNEAEHLNIIINSCVDHENRAHLAKHVKFLIALNPDDIKLIPVSYESPTLGEFQERLNIMQEIENELCQFPDSKFPLLRYKIKTVFSQETWGYRDFTSSQLMKNCLLCLYVKKINCTPIYCMIDVVYRMLTRIYLDF